MKIVYILIKLLFLSLMSFNSLSEEIQIESSDMNIINNGNTILASNSKIIVPNQNIKIKSKLANYEKNKNIVTLEEEVFFDDKNNEVLIESNFIKYDLNKELIFSKGKTSLLIESEYKVNSKNIYYNRILKIIYSKSETLIEDGENNFYILKDGFEFNVNNEIIKSNKSIIIDKNNNKYIFENLLLNLKSKEIAGNELKIEFEKSYFGNKKNDPLLKGRSSYSNNEELKVYKAVFSTCNIENKNCRGWELNSDEFKHDKEKRIFEYKNSWLKIFDRKVFFTPYFNHPDPTVKRKSGFLTPTYSTSESLGISFNIPYFKVISFDKDITFSPRYYADKSFLLQNEYRQALKNSNVLSDFSFLIGDAGTKGHFFYNQVGNLNDNLDFELNLQSVEGDNYLKNYKLIETSNLIKNDNLLISNLDLNWKFEDASLDTSLKIFEDLSRNYSDRYQYVFPNFKFSKIIEIPKKYNGKFTFNSYGYNKLYDTNVTETVITNDFLFSSDEFVNSKGVVSNYNIFLKNPSSYAKNSSNFEDDENYDLYGTIKLDSSFPLQKKIDQYIHYLRPVASVRYSPNGNSDISSKDVLLNYDNVFSLNRIGTSDQVEGGDSLSMGLEFKRSDNLGTDIFDFKIANVLKSKENSKLPTKSKLNKTRSDFFGSLNYNFNKNLKFGYDFSYDRDLEYSNLEGLNVGLNLNNVFTDFYYYTTKNDLGKNETISNSTLINLNTENSFEFSTSKDLIDDFTEFYNLIYTYETDCISLNLNYNKSFYRDGTLEPNESLSFLIKIIPFTELGVPNLGKLINK
mgnify:CR=1 FL=1|tara:strand:+ start:202 stop:2595 length:2394 start_codon:yes stop_codon:yes gene_type:complete